MTKCLVSYVVIVHLNVKTLQFWRMVQDFSPDSYFLVPNKQNSQWNAILLLENTINNQFFHVYFDGLNAVGTCPCTRSAFPVLMLLMLKIFLIQTGTCWLTITRHNIL